jgi:hypothetical protein
MDDGGDKMKGYRPFVDDRGDRLFRVTLRKNFKGEDIYDVEVSCADNAECIRDGKFMPRLFLFSLTQVEKDRLKEVLK